MNKKTKIIIGSITGVIFLLCTFLYFYDSRSEIEKVLDDNVKLYQDITSVLLSISNSEDLYDANIEIQELTHKHYTIINRLNDHYLEPGEIYNNHFSSMIEVSEKLFDSIIGLKEVIPENIDTKKYEFFTSMESLVNSIDTYTDDCLGTNCWYNDFLIEVDAKMRTYIR